MDTTAETFGSVVKARMRQRRVSPKELASVIHRSESQVSLLLRDKVATPPPDVVAEIASFLGIDEVRLVRLIGYLATVPEGDLPRAWPFAPEDVRETIMEELATLTDEQAAHVLATMRFMQGASGGAGRDQ